MPVIRLDTLLQEPGISSLQQHLLIIVRFYYKKICLADVRRRDIANMAKVGYNRYFPGSADYMETNGFRCIVTYRECFNIESGKMKLLLKRYFPDAVTCYSGMR